MGTTVESYFHGSVQVFRAVAGVIMPENFGYDGFDVTNGLRPTTPVP